MVQLAFNRLGLPLLVTWSTLRVLLYGAVDRRPLLGFEAADLQRSMFYHYGLRGHLDYGFLEQVGRDGFKPPLWYGAPQFCVRGATPCPPWTSCSSMQSPCWPPMLQ